VGKGISNPTDDFLRGLIHASGGKVDYSIPVDYPIFFNAGVAVAIVAAGKPKK